MAPDFEQVEVKQLVKRFGPTIALAGVDLTLRPGSITAVEGPNGSGKSTLLSVLALLARPTRGELRFGAHDPFREPALRARIGLLSHAPMLCPELTGTENLALTAELYAVPDAARTLAEISARFELGAFMQREVRGYSRGQLQRVSLARALLHAPKLLLLDEPSTGLDARGVQRLLDVVRAERARGAIVVLVTHDAVLAGAVADRRVTLRQGRVSEEAA